VNGRKAAFCPRCRDRRILSVSRRDAPDLSARARHVQGYDVTEMDNPVLTDVARGSQYMCASTMCAQVIVRYFAQVRWDEVSASKTNVNWCEKRQCEANRDISAKRRLAEHLNLSAESNVFVNQIQMVIKSNVSSACLERKIHDDPHI
jgi:hypothetical protein